MLQYASFNMVRGLLSRKPVKVDRWASSLRQGRRNYMQDRVVEIADLAKFTSNSKHCEVLSEMQVFGVFDGHGGDITTEFAANNFPQQLCLSLENQC